MIIDLAAEYVSGELRAGDTPRRPAGWGLKSCVFWGCIRWSAGKLRVCRHLPFDHEAEQWLNFFGVIPQAAESMNRVGRNRLWASNAVRSESA
jgi:hypothetical protein